MEQHSTSTRTRTVTPRCDEAKEPMHTVNQEHVKRPVVTLSDQFSDTLNEYPSTLLLSTVVGKAKFDGDSLQLQNWSYRNATAVKTPLK